MDARPLHVIDIPVRWSDLDADGRVNNVLVLRFAEEARMRLAEALRVAIEASELMPVVARVECTYHAPIGYRVEVHCTRMGRSSVDLLFDIRDAADTGRCFATAKAVWVWVDRSTGRSAPAPECLRRATAAASG